MNRSSSLILAGLLAMAIILAVPAQAVTYGAMGSKVLAANTDFNPQFAATAVAAATLCGRDTGVGATSTDDLFYVNVDGAGTVVQAFDIRLTAAESRTAGTLVGAADTDVGQTFNSAVACSPLAANLRFLEMDGLPGFTAGDMLVWSLDTTLGAGDLRLSSTTSTGQDATSLAAGTIVNTGNTDLSNIGNNNGLYPDCTGSPQQGAACASSAILQGAGEFALRHYDANLNAAVDTGDAVLVSHNAAATPAPLSPNINDVFLIGSTFGTKVTRSSTDYLLEPEVLCDLAITAGCYTVAPTLGYIRIGAGDSTCDRLVMHFREYESNDKVQPDDVLLYSTTGTCTAIPPASSPAAGSRVTSATTHFQGTSFQAAPVAMDTLIFYVDVNGNSRFDFTDPVYLDKPAAFGGGALLTVTTGDLRMTAVTAGASSFGAGTVVGASDSDIAAFAGSAKNPDGANSWFIRKLNHDGANEIALHVVPSVMFHDVDADGFWDPVTESVYRDVGTTATGCTAGTPAANDCVSTGDFLLYAGSDTALTASSTTAIDCATGPPADCAFAATTLLPLTDVRVTGTDTTIDASRGETVFYSRDAFVNDEDFAFPAATGSTFAAGQVSCAGNGCDNEGMHASDVLYVSRCLAAGCPGRLMLGDVQIAPTMGTRTTSTGADFVPSLIDLPTAGGNLLRYNRGEAGNTADDTFYASTDGATLTSQDVRLTAFTTKTAGSVVTSSDTEELGAAIVADATSLATRIAARDIDGLTGYTLNDAVYVNNAAVGMGGTADAVLSAFDLRLTGVTGGAQTFSAGTMVFAGNGDLNSGTAFTGLGAWLLGFHDDNLNGVVDTGDVVYALPPGSAALSTLPQPPLGAIRLTGTGVATGGGGGGGSTPVVTTTSTTSGSVTSSTSASVTDSSTSGTGTDSGTFTTGTGTDTGTGTGDGDGGGDNSTPGLGFAVLVFALAAAVLVARRKL